LEQRSIADLKSQLKDNRLAVAALMAFPFKAFARGEELKKDLEDFKAGSELAAKIGAPVLLAYIAQEPPQGVAKSDLFTFAGDRARRYGEVAARLRLSVALEPIGLAPFMSTPGEALRIAQTTGLPNVGIMMDTFHYFKSSVQLPEIQAVPVAKLLICHVNDAPDLPREQLADSDRVYCGLGAIPLVEEFRLLKKMGFRGYLSVEIFNKDYWNDDHETVVRQSKEHLDNVLSQL
jgi:sugar phosphate isomerase/epimerase